jgi:hypothetical protein
MCQWEVENAWLVIKTGVEWKKLFSPPKTTMNVHIW